MRLVSPRAGRWLRRATGAAVAIAAVAVIVGAVEDGSAADRERQAAEARERTARRQTAQATATLEQLAVALREAAAAADRDARATEAIDNGLAMVAAFRARVAEAEAELEPLNATSAEQDSRIQILRACVRVLDSVRSHLLAGDSGAANSALARGREACERADRVAGGVDASVHPFDFPDPFIVRDGDRYLAFGTNGPAGTIQFLSSPDLERWSVGGSALVGVPRWAAPGFSWAPSVLAVPGGFRLYYTVRHAGWGVQCVTVASATAAGGPYVDDSLGPLVCQRELGGSIDPSPFRGNDGRPHLVWKSEGETVGRVGQIWSQGLAPDGLSMVGAPRRLIDADREWEDGIIEAPSMAPVAGTWLLLYSGNSWNSSRYAVGYALCYGPQGPCGKPEGDNLALRSTYVVEGPGSAEMFRTPDRELKVAYAGWDVGEVGHPNPRRLHLAPVSMGPDGPGVG